MTSPNPFSALVKSRKFWLAVIAVIQTIVFSLIPTMPDTVWQAIDAILVWLIGMIALEDASLKLGAFNNR